MFRNVLFTGVFTVFLIFMFSCELPRDEVVNYSDANYIKGFSVPRKMKMVNESLFVVFDSENGLYLVDINKFDGFDNVNNSSFSVDDSFILPAVELVKPVLEKDSEGNEIPVENDSFIGILPHTTKRGVTVKLNPADFDLVKTNDKDILYVLAYTSGTSASSLLDGSYFVYKLDITNPADVKVPSIENRDIVPLDIFPVNDEDEAVTSGNVGRAIVCDSEYIYISGNVSNPVRVIKLSESGTVFDESAFVNVSGTTVDEKRKEIRVSDNPKRTRDPGLITSYKDTIFVSSRNISELGIHHYKITEDKLSVAMAGETSSAGKNFPKSMKVREISGNEYLISSYYTKAGFYNLNSNLAPVYLNAGNDVLVSDAEYFKNGETECIVLSYNYKIVENKYNDYGYDHKMLYSGLLVYENPISSPVKVKEFLVDGSLKGVNVIRKNDGLFSFSISQNNGRIYIHKLN